MANGLPDLMTRVNRKLQIQKGMHFTPADLALLVSSGGYAAMQDALTKEMEKQCQSQKQPPKEAAWPVPKRQSIHAPR
jgi:hypothetical protein